MKIILVLGILLLTSACTPRMNVVQPLVIITAEHYSDGINHYTVRVDNSGAQILIITRNYYRVGDKIELKK